VGPQTTKLALDAFRPDWTSKCEVTLQLAKTLGNIYTGSLYNGLLSLLADRTLHLRGKNLLLFSYGSGCASSIFRIQVKGDISAIRETA